MPTFYTYYEQSRTSVQGKSNEITAIPALPAVLEPKGATVSIDAMGCQYAIVQQIVDASADYVLGLKGHQGALYRDVKALFASLRPKVSI